MLGNERQPEPAQVVRHYLAERWSALEHTGAPRPLVLLRSSTTRRPGAGTTTTLPVHAVPPDRIDDFARAVRAMLRRRSCGAAAQPRQKQAWFDRPKDHKDDRLAVPQSFWQRTEGAFYAMLRRSAATAGALRPVAGCCVQPLARCGHRTHPCGCSINGPKVLDEQCADLKRAWSCPCRPGEMVARRQTDEGEGSTTQKGRARRFLVESGAGKVLHRWWRWNRGAMRKRGRATRASTISAGGQGVALRRCTTPNDDGAAAACVRASDLRAEQKSSRPCWSPSRPPAHWSSG